MHESPPAGIDPDLALLDAFRRDGDRESLGRLLAGLTPIAYALARQRLGHASDAEDAVQHAFMEAIAACRSFRSGRGTVRGWLLTIVTNRCLKMQRAATRRMHHEAASPSPPPACPPDPDLVTAVHAAMGELPEHERTAVELRFLAGLGFPEVAAALERKEKTVRVQVGRGLDRLRDLLRQRGLGPVEVGTVAGALALPPGGISDGFAASVADLARTARMPAAGGTGAGLVAMLAGAVVLLGGLTWTLLSRTPPTTAVAVEPLPLPSPQPQVQPLAAATGLQVVGRSCFQSPGQIHSLAFSPDGRLLAAICSSDLVFWDVPEGTVRWSINGGGDSVHWRSPTELIRLSSGSLSVYDLAAHRILRQIALPSEDFSSLAIHASGRWCAVPVRKQAGQADRGVLQRNTGVAVVDLDAGTIERVADDLVQHAPGWLTFADLSPDGTRLVFLENYLNSARQGVRLGLVERKSGTVLERWELPGAIIDRDPAVDWLPDGRLRLTMEDGKRTWLARPGDPVVISSPGMVFSDAAGTPMAWFDGRNLRQPDRGADGDRLVALPDRQFYNRAASADGRWLAISTLSQQPVVIDVRERCLLAPGSGSLENRPSFAAWCDDGSLLLEDGAGGALSVSSAGVLRRLGAEGVQTCAGRLAVTSDWRTGSRMLWDLAENQALGHLTGIGPRRVDDVRLSPSGRRALVRCLEASRRLTLHDLTTNTQTGQVLGANRPEFGQLFDLTGVSWSTDERRFLLAEQTATFFGMKLAEHANPPTPLSGCYDAASGQQLFPFRDQAGIPVMAVVELASTPDWNSCFLRTGRVADLPSGKPMTGLWNAADGRFIRVLPDPGHLAGFLPDGSLLIGLKAAIDPAHGATVVTYPTSPWNHLVVPSPSHTWLAIVRPGPRIELREARTGLVRWTLDCADPDLAKATADAVVWHPGEHRLSVLFQDRPYVAMIDLFLPGEPAADPAAAAIRLAAGDEPTAHAAVLALIAAGERGVAALTRPTSFPAILALEHLARNGAAGADTALQTAAQAGDLAPAARDALARLAAEARAAARAATPPVWETSIAPAKGKSDF